MEECGRVVGGKVETGNRYSSGVDEDLPIYRQTHMLRDTKILNTGGKGGHWKFPQQGYQVPSLEITQLIDRRIVATYPPCPSMLRISSTF